MPSKSASVFKPAEWNAMGGELLVAVLVSAGDADGADDLAVGAAGFASRRPPGEKSARRRASSDGA